MSKQKLRPMKFPDIEWKNLLKMAKKRKREGLIDKPNRTEYVKYLIQKDAE